MPVLSDLAIAQAIVANGRWAVQLNWDRYLEPIDVVLGVPTGTAGASAPFATALAGWQSAHQLRVDGILGPDTWTVMRRPWPRLTPSPVSYRRRCLPFPMASTRS